jgi:DNA-binding CsgD family transcriptional regulator
VSELDADADHCTVEISAPVNLDALEFTLESEKYLLLSFPVVIERHDSAPEAKLTESEREVCALVVDGCSNFEIARVRGTSPRTVANQIAAIYRKLGVGSRRELRARTSREE